MNAIYPSDPALRIKIKSKMSEIYQFLSNSLLTDDETDSVFKKIKDLVEITQEAALAEKETTKIPLQPDGSIKDRNIRTKIFI